jgi:hypothetical protein
MPTLTVHPSHTNTTPQSVGVNDDRKENDVSLYTVFDYRIRHISQNKYTDTVDETAQRLRCASRTNGILAVDCLDYAEFLWTYISESVDANPESPSTSIMPRTRGIQTKMGTSHSLWIAYVDTVLRASEVVALQYSTHHYNPTTHLVPTLLALHKCEQVIHGKWAQHDKLLRERVRTEVTARIDELESMLLYSQINDAVAVENWDRALLALLDYGMCIDVDFDVDVCTLYARCMVSLCKHAQAVSVWRLLQSLAPAAVPAETLYKSEFLNKQLYGLEIPVVDDIKRVVAKARAYGMQLQNTGSRLHEESKRAYQEYTSVGTTTTTTWRLAALTSLGESIARYTPGLNHESLSAHSSASQSPRVLAAATAFVSDQIVAEPTNKNPRNRQVVEASTPHPLAVLVS